MIAVLRETRPDGLGILGIDQGGQLRKSRINSLMLVVMLEETRNIVVLRKNVATCNANVGCLCT